MNNQQGFGLSELLIALLLASLVTICLMRHYLNTKQQYRHLQAALEQSIDLQLVTDMIRNSVRRAGFTPCLGIDHLISRDERNEHKKLVAIEIGRDGDSSLHLNRMSEYFDTVLQIMSSTELLASHSQSLHRGQSILIADCYHAEVQTINQIKQTSVGQRITIAKPLDFTYHEPIYVGGWLEETYSIHTNPRRQGTLFYHLHHAEELTTVVHNISSHLEVHRGWALLQVILGLDRAKLLTLETMVRTR